MQLSLFCSAATHGLIIDNLSIKQFILQLNQYLVKKSRDINFAVTLKQRKAPNLDESEAGTREYLLFFYLRKLL